MKEESKLKIGILLLAYTLTCMIILTAPTSQVTTLPPDNTVSDILDQNDFHNWTTHDQKLLTEMMRLTAKPDYNSDDSETFTYLVQEAPPHVLKTYIDLINSHGPN